MIFLIKHKVWDLLQISQGKGGARTIGWKYKGNKIDMIIFKTRYKDIGV